MPINIQYGPASLAGALAYKAGKGDAVQGDRQFLLQLQASAQRDQQIFNAKQAQDKSFELQMAAADRMLASKLRTPAADHIGVKADAVRADQQAAKDQLDELMKDGTITPEAYRKAVFGLVSGNKTLITDLLKPGSEPKPNITNNLEVDILRRPFQEKRKMLGEQMANVMTKPSDKPKLQQQIDALYAEEAAALSQWRERGPGVFAPPPAAPRAPGTSSVTRTPQMTGSEQNILDFARSQAGVGASKITGGGGPQTFTSRTEAPPVAIQTDAEWASLPSGTAYVGPDGVLRRKK